MTTTQETAQTAPLLAAFDTETFYDTDYSVADLGPQAYCADPRFKCYLISVSRTDGFRYSGPPESFDWEHLRGIPLIAWNAGFDMAVLDRMVDLSIAPTFMSNNDWLCSANLAVYLGFPRSLAQATAIAFGEKVDKSIRNKDMKGKTLDTMDADLRARVIEYAQRDADLTLKFWLEYSHLWPEHERRLSDHTYRMGAHGLPMSVEQLQADIDLLKRALFNAEVRIPWRETHALLSPKALAEECRKVGIEPPASLSKTSEECAEWEDRYGDTYPWVAAMRDYRRINTILSKLETAKARLTPEGRMPFSLKYGGAHTLRFSGDSGFNVQNLPRKPFYFDDKLSLSNDKTDTYVDLRGLIVAPPGKRFVVADYAQIEARITPWLAGDKQTLELARTGMSVYEILGRTSFGWTGGSLKKENPDLYLTCKTAVLGLGFGCGWAKYPVFAKTMLTDEQFDKIFAAPISEKDRSDFLEYQNFLAEKGLPNKRAALARQDYRTQCVWVNSWKQVTHFRKTNPKIVALWKKLDETIKRSVGGMCEITLPSGRSLRYFNVELHDDSIRACTTRGGNVSYFHGPLLTENCLAGNALVLSEKRGWIPISSLEQTERVFDGVEYVSHAGVKLMGVKETIACHGIRATPEHRFLSEDGWVSTEFARQTPGVIWCYSHEEDAYPTRNKVREHVCASLCREARQQIGSENAMGSEVRLRTSPCEAIVGSHAGALLQQEMPAINGSHSISQINSRNVFTPSIRGVAQHEAAMLRQESSGISQLRSAGDHRMLSVGARLRCVLEGYGSDVAKGTGPGSQGQQRGLLARELQVDNASRQLSQQKNQHPSWVGAGRGGRKRSQAINPVLPLEGGHSDGDRLHSEGVVLEQVYDIINCGPRHQFLVRGPGSDHCLIAHNCVQSTARDVIAEAILRLHDAGYKVVMHVHDEIVCEVNENDDCGPAIADIMTTPPSWAKTLPLGVEWAYETKYCK